MRHEVTFLSAQMRGTHGAAIVTATTLLLSLTATASTASADEPPTAPAEAPAPTEIPPSLPGPATDPTAQIVPTTVPAGTVPIKFVGARVNDRYHVVTITSMGRIECDAPCSLNLPPGNMHVIISGTKSYEQDITVPSSGGGGNNTTTTVSLNRPCPYCLTIGSGVMVLGAVLFGIGYIQLSAADCQSDDIVCNSNASGNRAGAYFIMTAAAVSFLIGATMVSVALFQPSPHAAVKAATRARLEGIGAMPGPNGAWTTSALFRF